MSFRDGREHVFVLGSDRSGTSLLAAIIQSSPVYATYAAETRLLAECEIRYGDIRKKASRDVFLNDWFNSRQFRRTGLTRQEILDALPAPESYYEFLGVYMGMVANRQGCDRWVDSTPDNANCISEISKTFPSAKIIHAVRDGRAVSASKAKLGWSGVRTGDFDKALCYSSLLWQRAVVSVRKEAELLGSRYMEIKYEVLVENPEKIIDELSGFLGVPAFDKGIIDGKRAGEVETARSPLHKPNTAYGDMGGGISNVGAYRWKTILSKKQICAIEYSVGRTLSESGYPLDCEGSVPPSAAAIREWRKLVLSAKLALKQHTPIGGHITSPLEIGQD